MGEAALASRGVSQANVDIFESLDLVFENIEIDFSGSGQVRRFLALSGCEPK